MDAGLTAEEAAWATQSVEKVRREVHKVIVGQNRVLDETLLALLCGDPEWCFHRDPRPAAAPCG